MALSASRAQLTDPLRRGHWQTADTRGAIGYSPSGLDGNDEDRASGKSEDPTGPRPSSDVVTANHAPQIRLPRLAAVQAKAIADVAAAPGVQISAAGADVFAATRSAIVVGDGRPVRRVVRVPWSTRTSATTLSSRQ
jgi:hypothetical protein